ncbi:MAG TPA: aminodeoxychorismate synthase component I [Blastocatellia bacterium]|jgi:para-aminobenzoate synthetase/4-amino-4-deoxychorismate lyase|nr:aminodeoxychorismate synthase component I [Blastocatellia bacterium]
MKTAVFESFDGSRTPWHARFESPREVREARTLSEVPAALRLAEEECDRGRWAVVMLAYESAPAFDAALKAHAPCDFPPALVAVFDRPCPASNGSANIHRAYRASPWKPRVSRGSYIAAVQKIREYIAAGDTYQVNYTIPLECEFEGDAWSWYRELGAAQGARYSAYLDLGERQVISLSPELFFERRGERLAARPMKGTMSRGRWAEEDDDQAARLAACPKNRAENVMIVDLLRNDLGRISTAGSVRVPSLFDVERYPSLLQMTSTIESVCKPGLKLTDILRALFPCGSITGAPKVRTMEIIEELERAPRGIYTGAIGIVRPGGDCIFNVAIRTLVLDGPAGRATFGVGGGITYDSTPEAEFEECLLKARFLDRPRPDFQLLETILLEDGRFFLLERHIQRLTASARYFGFPCDVEEVRHRLEQARLARSGGRWKIRLLAGERGAASVESSELAEEDERVWRVRLAPAPIDRNDPFIHNKTTHRKAYDQAARKPEDCDDLIFWNEAGEVTESSIANIVFTADGRKWTPPRGAGLLGGTFRDELLAQGEILERAIHRDELRRAEPLFLINSVRKWMRAVLID